MIQFKSISNAKKITNMGYLGGVKKSTKMMKSFKHGTLTYCLYLAPSNMSGYNVCPNSLHCREFCLNGSGHNLINIIANGSEEFSIINKSRIKKTKLFFEERDFFMQWLIAEIKAAEIKAAKDNMEFSVRLNGTSDIDINLFNFNNQNILEIFPNIQFYDYTKVFSRMKDNSNFKNYDLTFSFNGYNWELCEKLLNNGHKIAAVFGDNVPTQYKGYNVINGDNYDMRYLDNGGNIIGLTYHKVAANYKNGKYQKPNTKFVIFDHFI